MPVQIIVTGEHATDALAELQNLAVALTGGQEAPAKNVVGATSAPKPTIASAPSTQAPAKSASTAAPASGGATDNKLSREDQDAAVAAMVEAGEKDERYNLLTKGRQKAVDDGIAAKVADIETGTPEIVDDMFGDDETPAAPVVTAQTIRDMMGALGKDEKGNSVQDNLLKIRDILTKFVTKGAEIRVGNIPADKLQAVYAELKKLEA
jgi:hypothetical protein